MFEEEANERATLMLAFAVNKALQNLAMIQYAVDPVSGDRLSMADMQRLAADAHTILSEGLSL